MSGLVGVIGGSGFIGSRLCQEFSLADIPFRIIDKRPSELFPSEGVIADVTNVSELRGALIGCDAIVNLAAEHRDDVRPRSLYDLVNVDGARNVCKVAQDLDIRRILFTSSVAVFGFAKPGTGEGGEVAPFNDYGRTKAEAEEVYLGWHRVDPERRSLIIVRPTVVFGERNRGNVYNLLKQISTGFFVMIGSGKNRKSMAYVGNVAAFLRHMLRRGSGVHVCNYVDTPDIDMDSLVSLAQQALGKAPRCSPRLPYALGYAIGGVFDLFAYATGRVFPISRVRVQKFCATTQFSSAFREFGFEPPFSLREGLERTLRSEFLSGDAGGPLFYSE